MRIAGVGNERINWQGKFTTTSKKASGVDRMDVMSRTRTRRDNRGSRSKGMSPLVGAQNLSPLNALRFVLFQGYLKFPRV